MSSAIPWFDSNDAEAFRAAFHSDGFVVAKGLFGPSDVRRMKRAFNHLQATAHALEEDGMVMHEGTQFVIDRDDERLRIHRIVWCAGVSRALDKLGRDPRLLSRVASLLQHDHFEQLINQAHFKMPGDGVAFEWHQDSRHRRYGTDLWTDIDGKGSFVETFTAVDAMTAENGPLRFIPGSHRHGHVSDASGQLPAELVDERDAVEVHLDEGDVVFFGPFVFHASDPNRGSAPRRAFLNGFSLPGANHRDYPGADAGRLVSVDGEIFSRQGR